MLNLFDMLQKAQDGQSVSELSRQFGISPGEAQSAIDALLPAFTLAMQGILRDPQSWPTMLASMWAVANPFVPAGLQPDPATAFFGSGALRQNIAAQAASVSGLSAERMQDMIAVMAGALMNSFAQTLTQNLSPGAIMPGVMPGAGPMGAARVPGLPDNWGELMGQMMQAGIPDPSKPEADREAAFNPFDPGSYAQMMVRLMDPSPGQDEGQPKEPSLSPSEQGMEAWASAVETGREVQAEHLEALRALFSASLANQARGSP